MARQPAQAGRRVVGAFGHSMQINLSHKDARTALPYSYGLAALTTRIYNSGACSGGQGARPSQRARPLEATRPVLLGTPGLVYSPSQRAARHSLRFIGTSHWNSNVGKRLGCARPTITASREIAR